MPRFDKIRAAIVLTALAAAAWGGFWHWRSSAALERAEAAPTALAAEGWRYETDGVARTGAPNRVDLVITAPRLAAAAQAPDRVWTLSAPSLSLKSLVYRDAFIGAYAPPGLLLAGPDRTIRLVEGAAEASLVFGEGVADAAALARLSLSLPEPVLEIAGAQGGAPDRLRAALLELHLRPDPDGAAETRRAYLRLDGLRADADPAAAVTTLKLDGAVRFARTPGRHPARLGTVRAAAVKQGGGVLVFPDAEVALHGALEATPGGWSGSLAFATDAAPAALARLTALGLLTPDQTERIAARIAPSGRLAGVVTLRDGRLALEDIEPEPISLGPLTLPMTPPPQARGDAQRQ